ncbi:MAG: isoleucine--tRNA ligase [Puniceicoccales bacterium]|jgi:isoleucyl-tRNA synthetase|nr:isoleucine--tRNA ligase [Puniceicoccales bacterium]
MIMQLKDTLNLPKTNFPLRAELARREPQRIGRWNADGLYEKIQDARRDAPRFFLHDGPPFTNGDVHIGTALNKILKDIIIRYKTLRGYRAPYVPGWDCHGLPIEHKVVKNLHAEGRNWDAIALRRACAQFSRDYSSRQRKQFERLGLLADWKREYRTMDPHYEAAVLEFFARCVENKLVYRSKKPVYWSIPCRTALAEAEIEYKDVRGPSIWVKFPLEKSSAAELSISDPAHVVIWTTTPWSLPSNRAIAVHPQFHYAALSCNGERYVVESSSVERFINDCQLSGVKKIAEFAAGELIGKKARHPFIERPSPICGGDFVTNSSGTGCVHCAPAHGMEDYVFGLQNHLDVYCPIDDDGRYVNDGEMPLELVGMEILDKDGRCPASEAVIDLLRKNGNLLMEKTITHAYPHCWRSKTPVIYRAMSQWFLNLEDAALRETALDSLKFVQWTPDWGQNRMHSALATRPDWCISRQRTWGIPLPVFFDGDGNALLDGKVIRAVAEKVRQFGSDCWFTMSADELLAGIPLEKAWQGKKLRPGTDTLDVWIDSGCSSKALPLYGKDLYFPADLYAEGTDQHRGWFQSSLWCSTINCGSAPYKAVLTHGFIVGEDRKKISKSSDKPQSSDDYVARYGADVIRLWIASEDFRDDIPLSDGILEHIVVAYGTIRNTLRFQLGNLGDFERKRDGVNLDELLPIDCWALAKLSQLINEVTKAYEAYEFHRIYRMVLNFCTVTLSATYHDILKDRLYTFAKSGKERRSAQTALWEILMALLAVLTPIITLTADEAYAYLQCDEPFAEKPAHLLPWPNEKEFSSCAEPAERVERLLTLRAAVNQKLEEARREKIIGKSLEARVILRVGEKNDMGTLLADCEEILPELFIVSQAELTREEGNNLSIAVEPARGERCSRCWRHCEDLQIFQENEKICSRCGKVLGI